MPSSDQPLTLKPFTTERLHCRLVELRDLNEIFTMYSREDVTRYLPYDTWQSHHHAKEWWHKTQKRHNSGEARQYAVQLNANGSVIGSIILFGFTAEPCAELGYSLHSDYWGQGLMQEVLAELIFRCHSELKLKRMIARVAPPISPHKSYWLDWGLRKSTGALKTTSQNT